MFCILTVYSGRYEKCTDFVFYKKKKNFQISEHQNKDQRKDGWYGAIAILTMQTHTPSFLQVLST